MSASAKEEGTGLFPPSFAPFVYIICKIEKKYWCFSKKIKKSKIFCPTENALRETQRVPSVCILGIGREQICHIFAAWRRTFPVRPLGFGNLTCTFAAAAKRGYALLSLKLIDHRIILHPVGIGSLLRSDLAMRFRVGNDLNSAALLRLRSCIWLLLFVKLPSIAHSGLPASHYT